jgi:predicted ATPase
LHTLPHTPERAQQELGMQIPLVNMYMATKGWGASDVEHVYRRARKLCQQVGDMSQLFPVLYGLCANAFLQLKLQRAREIGEEFLGMTQGQDDPAPILVAHRVLGTTLHIRGELTLARTHLEQAIALYDSHQHRSLALRYGQDPGVAGLSFLAWTLEQLGYPDQARQRRSEALSLARELSHPFSLAYALTHRLAVLWTLVNRLYEDLSTFQEEVEELFALSADHGFANMLAHATMCQGRVLVMQGQMQAGMVQMRQAMATRPTGALMNRALDLALLAEAHGRIKQTDMGIALVEEALALVEGRYLNAAELYRLKGELLLAESSDHQAAAERCFHQALDVARCQQAKCLELRAAMSLARLWQSQGNRQEAYDLLSPVYEWFTEGFDTADLIEAKALLNKLSEGQA